MTRMFLICVLLLSGCASKTRKVKPIPEHPIVSQCMILDADGNLRWSYPSWLCHFYPDGRFLTVTEKSMQLRGRNLELLWEKEMMPHHMISTASNGDILTLGSQFLSIAERKNTFKGVIEVHWDTHQMETKPVSESALKEKFRADTLVRLNPAGRIVAEMSLASQSNYPMPWLIHIATEGSKFLPYETSHANSIYEIPPNASKLPEFKAGNIIVNDLINRSIFITGPDLKEILWRVSYEKFGWFMLHDVSVLNNGHILLFKNLEGKGSGPSSLEEIDPVTMKVVWKYERPESFTAYLKGSVQNLPAGRVLFAHTTGKTSLVELLSRDGKPLWSLDLSKHTDIEMQGAYSLPVENFLRNNNQHQVSQDYPDLDFSPLAVKSTTLKVKKFPAMTEEEVRQELKNQGATLRRYLAKQVDPYHGESTVSSACNIPGTEQNQIKENAKEIRMKFLLITSPQFAIDCYGTSKDRQFDQRLFLYCKNTKSFYEINEYSPIGPTPPNDELAYCGRITDE